MGLMGAQAATSVAIVGIPAAILNDEAKQQDTIIRGQYQDGFWFDRELFSVWVVSNTPETSRKVGEAVALNTCENRKGRLVILKTYEWQERGLFIPIKLDRYSFELRFRCPESNQPKMVK